MELTMALQDDSTPWVQPSINDDSASESTQPLLNGRSFFSSLGQVRRKPSRPDAPPTLSKSCTDKLCLKQCTSLLSTTTSLLISPQNAYLKSIIIPSSQISTTAIARAFSPTGRMAPLIANEVEKNTSWLNSGYSFRPFTVSSTELEFRHSRRQALQVGESLASSNISAAWTPHFCETLIGGTIQGRKQFSVKGASRVCKRRKWNLALSIAAMLGEKTLEEVLGKATYREVKKSPSAENRSRVKNDVKDVLGGWPSNDGGDGFGSGDVES